MSHQWKWTGTRGLIVCLVAGLSAPSALTRAGRAPAGAGKRAATDLFTGLGLGRERAVALVAEIDQYLKKLSTRYKNLERESPLGARNMDDTLIAVAGFNPRTSLGTRPGAIARLARGVDPEFILKYVWVTSAGVKNADDVHASWLHHYVRGLGALSATDEESRTIYRAFSLGKLTAASQRLVVKRLGKKRALQALGCSTDALGRTECASDMTRERFRRPTPTE